ncbi:epimerase isoform C [Chlorella sorokiniana]|nr:epimerase isoform C [Chlorella sorokiniana]|eukprot:PRW33657.1 epimerase isoform C [Chlorella sorokiniana]
MQDPSLANRRVRMGGPEVLTFRQLAALIGRVLGREVPCTALPVVPAKAAVATLRAAARATQSRRLLGLYRFLYFVLLVSLDETEKSLVGQAWGKDKVEDYLRQRAAEMAAAAKKQAPALDSSGAAALLQQRFSLEVERHNEDIQHTEARLRSALKELEIVRAEEARVLAQRTAALRREHEAAMQALERRFLADAEALQAGAGGRRRAPAVQTGSATAAAATAAHRQPAAKPAGLSVRFAPEPASSAAAQPAAARQGSSSDGSGGRERGGLMAHTSSSEFDDDSWLDEDSCGEEDLISSRPPPVKIIQSSTHTPRSLAASRCASFAAIGAAAGINAAAGIGAGVNGPASPRGSGGKVHLNLIQAAGGAPGSPTALRAYSPCTCSSGADAAGGVAATVLSPRSAGARMACCGVLNGGAARSYTSD